MMDLEGIRKRVKNGFRPFAIRMSDGREYAVPHQEFILVAPRTVVVVDEEGFVNVLYPSQIATVREAGELPVR